jgi:CHAT domain-containing protein
MGDAASEAALKKANLERFSLLHFATHAVAYEEWPERSSVVLAPGSEAEDGLLQSREIVELPFDGCIVILAACQSADGSVLRGEGVMSLARAFFQAGSPAVVGSLWPLRDDEAAFIFDALYRHLAAGSTLGAALRGAQRDAIGAGRPADAWAGLVVIGDGSVVPFRDGARTARPWVLSLALGGALLAGLGWWALGRRR